MVGRDPGSWALGAYASGTSMAGTLGRRFADLAVDQAPHRGINIWIDGISGVIDLVADCTESSCECIIDFVPAYDRIVVVSSFVIVK